MLEWQEESHKLESFQELKKYLRFATNLDASLEIYKCDEERNNVKYRIGTSEVVSDANGHISFNMRYAGEREETSIVVDKNNFHNFDILINRTINTSKLAIKDIDLDNHIYHTSPRRDMFDSDTGDIVDMYEFCIVTNTFKSAERLSYPDMLVVYTALGGMITITQYELIQHWDLFKIEK